MTRTVQELFDLTGRTAIVTGGGTHLGTAFTEALGDLGAKVYTPPVVPNSASGLPANSPGAATMSRASAAM